MEEPQKISTKKLPYTLLFNMVISLNSKKKNYKAACRLSILNVVYVRHILFKQLKSTKYSNRLIFLSMQYPKALSYINQSLHNSIRKIEAPFMANYPEKTQFRTLKRIKNLNYFEICAKKSILKSFKFQRNLAHIKFFQAHDRNAHLNRSMNPLSLKTLERLRNSLQNIEISFTQDCPNNYIITTSISKHLHPNIKIYVNLGPNTPEYLKRLDEISSNISSLTSYGLPESLAGMHQSIETLSLHISVLIINEKFLEIKNFEQLRDLNLVFLSYTKDNSSNFLSILEKFELPKNLLELRISIDGGYPKTDLKILNLALHLSKLVQNAGLNILKLELPTQIHECKLKELLNIICGTSKRPKNCFLMFEKTDKMKLNFADLVKDSPLLEAKSLRVRNPQIDLKGSEKILPFSKGTSTLIIEGMISPIQPFIDYLKTSLIVSEKESVNSREALLYRAQSIQIAENSEFDEFSEALKQILAIENRKINIFIEVDLKLRETYAINQLKNFSKMISLVDCRGIAIDFLCSIARIENVKTLAEIKQSLRHIPSINFVTNRIFHNPVQLLVDLKM